MPDRGPSDRKHNPATRKNEITSDGKTTSADDNEVAPKIPKTTSVCEPKMAAGALALISPLVPPCEGDADTASPDTNPAIGW